ncbi:MAG: hypothetical protein ACRDCW_11515 [Sarcina sp.]
MFNIFKEKQVQINLIDCGLFFIGILMLTFSDNHATSPDLTSIPVYITLAIGLIALAILNHFAHNLLGKRIFLYALEFISFLILSYTPYLSASGFIIYITFCIISHFIYTRLIDPQPKPKK